MSSAPALPSATEDFFAVYDFPFVLRTEDVEARNQIVRLYRRFLKTTPAKDPAEAVIANGYRGFRWALGEKLALPGIFAVRCGVWSPLFARPSSARSSVSSLFTQLALIRVIPR